MRVQVKEGQKAHHFKGQDYGAGEPFEIPGDKIPPGLADRLEKVTGRGKGRFSGTWRSQTGAGDVGAAEPVPIPGTGEVSGGAQPGLEEAGKAEPEDEGEDEGEAEEEGTEEEEPGTAPKPAFGEPGFGEAEAGQGYWLDRLRSDLGKEPTKEDLINYANTNHPGLTVDMSMLKEELIADIDAAEKNKQAQP